MVYPESFEQKIGFDQIRIMLAENCLCQLGRNHIDEMQMMSGSAEVEKALQLSDELRQILTFEEHFPQENYIDVTPYLKKLDRVGTHLEVAELVEIRKSINTIKQLQQFFREEKIRNKYRVISSEFSQLEVFPQVGQIINEILTREGLIKDNASPELKSIRNSKKDKQTAVTRKLQSILKHARSEGLVEADAEVTIRDGRPVIPVSAGNKRRMGGLVHDESASGKTVFIEPTEVVELNNDLRELEYAERREIFKILDKVSDEIRPYVFDMLNAYAQLGRIDFIRAKAKLAQRINGVKPILSIDHSMRWKEAKHPLLYLAHKKEAKEVVPLDIYMNKADRILLISGPNAGGKSVCLKTVGLLQYMLQSGIPVPMLENSEVCLFEKIMIDIGDEQSLENDLSTYSSHLVNMKQFIRTSDASSLLLIDEFGTGTEPALGGAIAEAILQVINTKEAFGVITTHYANLKHFASETPGIVNAAMLFDTQKIQPLFKLSIGEPGSSFAIEIARKIGLPEEILDLASEKVGSDYINFEKHLREIIRDKKYWEDKRSRIRKVERTLDNLYLNYSTELEDIQAERKRILKEAKQEAQALLKEANKKVENTIREIKESRADKERTRHAREELDRHKAELEHITDSDKYQRKLKEIEKAGRRLAEKSPELESAQVLKRNSQKKAEPKTIKAGDFVKMEGIDTVGEVMEITEKSCLVAFGSMITSVSPKKLTLAGKQKQAKKSGASQARSNLQERKLNFKSEIDVRGKRADEALAIVRDFVDDASMVSVRHLKILHGKGNGILRQLIQDYLRSVDIVKSAKDAHVDMGGAGITMVELDI